MTTFKTMISFGHALAIPHRCFSECFHVGLCSETGKQSRQFHRGFDKIFYYSVTYKQSLGISSRCGLHISCAPLHSTTAMLTPLTLSTQSSASLPPLPLSKLEPLKKLTYTIGTNLDVNVWGLKNQSISLFIVTGKRSKLPERKYQG